MSAVQAARSHARLWNLAVLGQGGRRLVPEPGRCGEPRVQAGSLHPRDSSRRKPTPRRRTSAVGPRAVASVLWCNGARCTYPASARACRSAPARWPGFSGATGPVAPTLPLPAHAGRPPRGGLGSLVQRGPLHLPGLCPRMPVGPRAVAWVLWCNGARCTYPASARACRSAPARWPGFSGATGPVAPTRPLPAHAGRSPRGGLGSLVQRGPLHLPGLCPRMPVGPRAVAWVLWCNGARCTYPASARACRSVPARWPGFSGATGPVAPTRPLPWMSTSSDSSDAGRRWMAVGNAEEATVRSRCGRGWQFGRSQRLRPGWSPAFRGATRSSGAVRRGPARGSRGGRCLRA